MTVKAVVEVDVADAAFTDFIKLWDKFKGEADELPDNLGQIGQKLKSESVSFGDLVAAMVTQAVLLKKMDSDGNKRTQNVVKQESSWKKMATYAKDFTSNVTSATKSLLRWTSITSVISGLVGAGGLYGLDRLAENVSLGRRSSAGLGTSYGEQKAFDLNYSRFIDPATFLGGVNQALHDVTQRVALLSLGVPQGELNSNNAVQVGSDLLLRLKDLADRTNPIMYQQAIEARGLGGIISVNDLERLHTLSRAEIVSQGQQLNKDAGAFGLDPQTQLLWQNFNTQLSRAGTNIETAFVKGLAPLTPALSELSDAVAQGVTTIMSSISPEDVKSLAKGIHDFAGYIASGQFKDGLKTFTTDIGLLAHKIVDALVWLDLIPDPNTKKPSNSATVLKNTAAGVLAGFVIGGLPGAIIGGSIGFSRGAILTHPALSNTDPNRKASLFDPGSWLSQNGGLNDRGRRIQNVEWDTGLPKGLLWQVYGAESGFGKNEGVSQSGALGAFQLMPKTAADLGVHDRTNFEQSSQGAGTYLASLLRRYHGNIDEALAGYNWGEGNVDKDIKRYGADWQQHIPRETQNYISKIDAGMIGDALGKAVKKITPAITHRVRIENNSGGSAVVTAHQAAH